MNMFSSIKEHAGIATICMLFFLTGSMRLNDLSLYTPDSSRYLIWGNSLAHGQGFVDNTLPDPDPYVVHAPLYPILIAPIEFLAPYSVVAVKAWTLLWGIAALIFAYLWLNVVIGKKGALVGTIILAANPLLWVYATEVLSDAPFIAGILAVFFWIEKLHATNGSSKKYFTLVVCAVVFAAMTREVGVTLVLGVVLYFLLLKQFKHAVIVLFAAGIFIALWYFRNMVYAPVSVEAVGNISLVFRKLMTGNEVSIVNEFVLRMWLAFQSYASQIGSLIFSPMYTGQFGHLFFVPSSLSTMIEHGVGLSQLIVSLCIGALIVAGVVSDLRTGEHVRLSILFQIFYVGAILLYPINDIRFLVPLLPFLVYYLLGGLRWVMRKIQSLNVLTRQPYAIVAVAVFMMPNIVSMVEMVKANYRYLSTPEYYAVRGDENALYSSLYARPWSKLGSWIDENVNTNDIIISPYKQLSTVVGDRKVLTLDKGITLPQFEMYLRDYGVHYVVAPQRWGSIKVFESMMMESKRFRFEKVFEVGDLFLFRVHSKLREPLQSDVSKKTDTLKDASTALRKGWMELASGQYPSANQYFLNALAMAPSQPEIVYYTLISYALLADSIHAGEMYQRLYAAPQAGSYLDPAKGYLQAMNQIKEARDLKYSDGVAVQSFKAASAFWKMGAFWKAAQLMNYSLHADSGYFVGLLWGFHFNLQLGDTVMAKTYLAILENMDRKNQVVATFRHIIELGDSIKHTSHGIERSKYHYTVASLYNKIELNDEAIDETELSLRDNPANIVTLIFFAEMLEKRSRISVTLDAYRQVLSLDPNNQTVHTRIDSLQHRITGSGS